jgi:hypothetical protein
MCSQQAGVLADTKGRLEKKQAQTYEEMMVRNIGMFLTD